MQQVEVLYENGMLRPLEPLAAHFKEHQRLIITIHTPGPRADRLDAASFAAAKSDADPAVSLEEVRQILAKVPGSLAKAVRAERDER
jgi:predicted DNA-binding antitoxin AbrB/MazE fold protein